MRVGPVALTVLAIVGAFGLSVLLYTQPSWEVLLVATAAFPFLLGAGVAAVARRTSAGRLVGGLCGGLLALAALTVASTITHFVIEGGVPGDIATAGGLIWWTLAWLATNLPFAVVLGLVGGIAVLVADRLRSGGNNDLVART